MPETTQITQTIQRGNPKKSENRLVQEWLCINGFNTKIDGDYGPATEAAVKQFQTKKGLAATGKTEPATFAALVAPMLNVMALTASNQSLRNNVISFAKAYLKEHPVEVGGQNMGPWVRYFMDGNQGEDFPWCAGFVTYLMRQIAQAKGEQCPVERTYSCDVLGYAAKKAGTLVRGNTGDLTKVKAGDIFLVRKAPLDWSHTGFVIEANADHLVTIEGNTNDEGSREGYEVCKRIRAYKGLDFICY